MSNFWRPWVLKEAEELYELAWSALESGDAAESQLQFSNLRNFLANHGADGATSSHRDFETPSSNATYEQLTTVLASLIHSDSDRPMNENQLVESRTLWQSAIDQLWNIQSDGPLDTNDYKVTSPDGLCMHSTVAALILRECELNPATKHHIRTAIREASKHVSTRKGDAKSRSRFMSHGAYRQMSAGDSSNLVCEHAIPISVLNGLVLKMPNPTPKRIADLVYRWTELAVITKEEDDRIKAAGLLKTMPRNWDGRNRFARYELADVVLRNNEYTGLKTCPN